MNRGSRLDTVDIKNRVVSLHELAATDSDAAEACAHQLRIEVLWAIAERRVANPWSIAGEALRTAFELLPSLTNDLPKKRSGA